MRERVIIFILSSSYTLKQRSFLQLKMANRIAYIYIDKIVDGLELELDISIKKNSFWMVIYAYGKLIAKRRGNETKCFSLFWIFVGYISLMSLLSQPSRDIRRKFMFLPNLVRVGFCYCSWLCSLLHLPLTKKKKHEKAFNIPGESSSMIRALFP